MGKHDRSAETDPRFRNVYDDEARAAAYDTLEFPGTYWLAFRDLPAILARHAPGRRALDFGCGTGRSTRFLRRLGFEPLGVDIAPGMLERARARDPEGDYRLVPDGSLPGLEPGSFDLVLATFTFDNVPGTDRRLVLFRALAELLADGGRFVNLVSSPEIYLHEWASFSTRDFPENRSAGSGDTVRIVMLDVPDRRPVQDILFTERDYRDAYRRAGLEVLELHHPLGGPDEPQNWVSETEVSPWSIYVLGKREGP
jgi:SAM-dependent methyltransferase